MSTRTTILTVSVLVLLGFFAGYIGRRVLPLPTVDIRFRSEVPYNVEKTRGRLANGEELVLVLITASDCAFCNDPSMPGLVREATRKLREAAAADSTTLVTIGMSLDWVPGQGWRFLEDVMNFDQVVIGRNWVNTEFLALESWVEAAIPQIVVYRQDLTVPDDPTALPTILRKRPALRVTGPDEIRQWVEAGCPL